MFCPNCNNSVENANFCPECGARINSSVEKIKKSPPKSIYYANVNGHEINLLRIFSKYGDTKRAYSYMKREYRIDTEQAKELLAPLSKQKKENDLKSKPTVLHSLSELATEKSEKNTQERARRDKIEKSGQVYCPKCYSTSISANKKGFGFIRGALGASVRIDVGMIAGGIGSNKIICSCMKCGYQWKPGKK